MKGKIITLCGSSKFKPDFLKLNKDLSLKGNVVFSLAIFSHYDNIKLNVNQKTVLDIVHLRKIDLSDIIMVITDVEGYIDKSTLKEIMYAKKLKKKICYYNSYEFY